MMDVKQDRRTSAAGRSRNKGILSRILSLRHWDPFDGTPTKEEYLVARAYRNLLEITKSVPNDQKARLHGDVAKDLIMEINRGATTSRPWRCGRYFTGSSTST